MQNADDGLTDAWNACTSNINTLLSMHSNTPLVEYNIILLRVYVPTHVAQDLQSCNKRGPLRGLRKFFIAQVLAIVTYSMHTLGTRIVSSVARPGKADFHDLVLFPVRRMNLSCT